MIKYLLAVGAAILFGVASALQHRAARAVPVANVSPIRLMVGLLRNRLWLIGRTADTAAVVLQTLALRLVSLVAIQSIVASGVIAAIGVSTGLDRRRPRRNEVCGSAIVVLGVVMIGVITHSNSTAANASFARWAEAAVVLTLVLLCAGMTIRSKKQFASSSLVLGAGAGACFATGSAFLKIGSLDLHHHGLGVDTIVALGGFAAVGIVGNVLAQRCFQLGEISIGLAALVATEPVAALVVGTILFHENVATSPRGLMGLAGLVVLAAGIVIVTRPSGSPANPPVAPVPSRSWS
jgi:drug/metabolite transporter (DMT)-like permease